MCTRSDRSMSRRPVRPVFITGQTGRAQKTDSELEGRFCAGFVTNSSPKGIRPPLPINIKGSRPIKEQQSTNQYNLPLLLPLFYLCSNPNLYCCFSFVSTATVERSRWPADPRTPLVPLLRRGPSRVASPRFSGETCRNRFDRSASGSAASSQI